MPAIVPVSNAIGEKLSRHDMINWVNQILSTDYKKVEELNTGIAYCQLMENVIPGSVLMKRLKTNAKNELEYIHNFRLFQTAFTKNDVHKDIPIQKLIKGKFQDNFEFLQWFKKFYDLNSNNTNKDLNQVILTNNTQLNNKIPSENKNSKNLKKPMTRNSMSSTSKSTNEMIVTSSGLLKPHNRSSSVSPSSSGILATAERNDLLKQISTLKDEGDMYYRKLRMIEILLETHTDANIIIKKVSDIVTKALLDESNVSNKKRRVSFKEPDQIFEIK